MARRRGWRVNLRPIAEWRTMLFLASSWLLLRWMLWPLLRLIYLVHSSAPPTTPRTPIRLPKSAHSKPGQFCTTSHTIRTESDRSELADCRPSRASAAVRQTPLQEGVMYLQHLSCHSLDHNSGHHPSSAAASEGCGGMRLSTSSSPMQSGAGAGLPLHTARFAIYSYTSHPLRLAMQVMITSVEEEQRPRWARAEESYRVQQHERWS